MYTFDAVFITFLPKIKKSTTRREKYFFPNFDGLQTRRQNRRSFSFLISIIHQGIYFVFKILAIVKKVHKFNQSFVLDAFLSTMFHFNFLSFFRQNYYRIFASNLNFRFCQNKFVSRFETGKKLSSFISSTIFLTRRDKFPSILCVVNNQTIH